MRKTSSFRILIQRHKLHCVHSLTVDTTVALGRRGIKQVCGSFLSDEVQNTSETTQSQTYEHTHASTLTRNRATFSDQCFCRTALSIIADLNRRIELSSVRTLVCLCRTFAGAILLWLKTLARRYVLAVVRRQSSKSIILFDFLVGNMSFREGYPVFLLVPPFLI